MDLFFFTVFIIAGALAILTGILMILIIIRLIKSIFENNQ